VQSILGASIIGKILKYPLRRCIDFI